MFDVLNRAFEGAVEYGQSFVSSIFGSGGAQPTDPGSWAGADGWGFGVTESVGITETSGATAAGWTTPVSFGGQLARSAAGALGSAARANQRTPRVNASDYTPGGAAYNSLMSRPRASREAPPPGMAPNPFSSRHPLAGWTRSLIGD